jgi:DNA (cytosine-5)-methyltransferase 1
MKPRLLDLFCGAGGAAMGYHRAGFDVVGVDIKPQPNYPFEFVQADAMTFDLAGFDVIHASPPCQAFTMMSNRHRGKGGYTDSIPDLLTGTLARLRSLTVPWVVENVVGSTPPLRPVIQLEGGMFGLGVHRRRLFESNVLLMTARYPRPAHHVGVYGKAPDNRRLYSPKKHPGNCNCDVRRAAASLEEAQTAMGMDWADWHGTKEAIPPAYTEFIGAQLLGAVTDNPGYQDSS